MVKSVETTITTSHHTLENGFVAFSVINVGIELSFLILQGATPVLGAMGFTAGYCGIHCTPMAANFNIMPVVLLETKDKYVIIKSQLPLAGTLLILHIIVMYIRPASTVIIEL